MKLGAVLFEPDAGALHVWHGLPYETPEALAVVHLAQMRHFMGRHIVQYESRRENQAPGEAESTARRAGAPSRGLVADADPLRNAVQRAAMILHPVLQISLGFAAQPVGKT